MSAPPTETCSTGFDISPHSPTRGSLASQQEHKAPPENTARTDAGQTSYSVRTQLPRRADQYHGSCCSLRASEPIRKLHLKSTALIVKLVRSCAVRTNRATDAVLFINYHLSIAPSAIQLQLTNIMTLVGLSVGGYIFASSPYFKNEKSMLFRLRLKDGDLSVNQSCKFTWQHCLLGSQNITIALCLRLCTCRHSVQNQSRSANPVYLQLSQGRQSLFLGNQLHARGTRRVGGLRFSTFLIPLPRFLPRQQVVRHLRRKQVLYRHDRFL